jgi:hypothetical protein
VNAKVLLDDLRSRGVSIETDGKHLLIDAPFGMITEELKATLSEHKARVIGILKFEGQFLKDRPEQDDGRRFKVRPSKHPGYTSLYDPASDEWHDFPTRDCFPSILEEAKGRRRKGGVACGTKAADPQGQSVWSAPARGRCWDA